MEIIWHLTPADRETYLRILNELVPILDREGFSFHIARPPSDSAPAKYAVKLKCCDAREVKL